MQPELSVLIPTIPSRSDNYLELMSNLLPQIKNNDQVEILSLSDNHQLSIGEKRNKLLEMARGRYISFVDDDDIISGAYLSEILAAINMHDGVDTINFDIQIELKDTTITCKYDLSYKDFAMTDASCFAGTAWHLHAWRSAIAKQVKFKDISYQEDMDWVSRVCPLANTQYKIDKVLYSYHYNPFLSESRNKIFTP